MQDRLSHSSVFLNPNVQIAAIIVFGIFILFIRLDIGELASLDDCYYAQKAKEILITGDWLTMHFAGEPKFDNVPLYMWLEAVMFSLFGIHEYTARFFSALFGLGTIILVYYLGRMWYNHRVGIYAGIVMLTTQFFLKFARRAMFDITLTFFVILALYCFWKSFDNKRYIIGFGLCTAAAILTKSVLGTFPILICGAYLMFSGQWRRLFSLQFLAGSLIGLSVASLWFIYETAVHGDAFLGQHFGWLIFERAFETSPEKQHWYSYFWYLRKLVEHYLPWVFLAGYGIYRMVRRNLKQKSKSDILILCWIFVIIGIMSIAHEKKVWYIMPVFPALALVCGDALDTLLASGVRRLRFLKTAAGFFLLTVFVIIVTPLTLNKMTSLNDNVIVQSIVHLDTNRHPDLKAIAHFAKNNTTDTETALNYRLSFWSNRPVFLFYSDVDLSKPHSDVESLKQILPDAEFVPLLTEMRYFTELQADSGIAVEQLMKRGEYIYCKIKIR